MTTPASNLIIYPAIDLKDGQGVRLLHGRFDKMTVYAPDPGVQAKSFVESGCAWIHVVDLDGALTGETANKCAVQDILAAGSLVQLGGGIRSLAAVDRWLEAGVSRVILGTAALKDPKLVREASRLFPGQIAVGADARDGMIAAEGWIETSEVPALDLVKRFEDCGVAAVIFTDIARDGTLTGVNAEATATLARAVSIPVIASGGVSGIADIRACAELSDAGINGVITGRALYNGCLDLGDALRVAAELREK